MNAQKEILKSLFKAIKLELKKQRLYFSAPTTLCTACCLNHTNKGYYFSRVATISKFLKQLSDSPFEYMLAYVEPRKYCLSCLKEYKARFQKDYKENKFLDLLLLDLSTEDIPLFKPLF